MDSVQAILEHPSPGGEDVFAAMLRQVGIKVALKVQTEAYKDDQAVVVIVGRLCKLIEDHSSRAPASSPVNTSRFAALENKECMPAVMASCCLLPNIE